MIGDYCKVFADIKKLNPFLRYINFGIYILFLILDSYMQRTQGYMIIRNWIIGLINSRVFIGLAITV